MANTANPHGLMPLGTSLSGGPQAIDIFQKALANANAIFRYDAVARQSGGYIGADGITPGTTQYSGVSLNYGAPSTLTDHHVIISPDALYEAMSDGAGLAFADMGLNANLALGAGSALTKMSGHVLATSTKAATATLDVHLLAKFDVTGNDYGQYSRIEFTFNKHRMANAVAGV